MKTIKDIEFQDGLKILVRIDVNEPMDEIGVPKDTFRLTKMIPTIKYLRSRGAKVILISHLGDPKGKVVENLKLDYIATEIDHLTEFKVEKIDYTVGNEVKDKIDKMKSGDVILLENLRFDPREELNDDDFSKELAQLADIYVNEAFSACHRSHASIVGIPKYLPSYGGFLLEKEISVLTQTIYNPSKPAVAVIGGAKIETKLPVIHKLKEKFDKILVGGRIANEYIDLYGKSNSDQIILPIDFANSKRYDIGPRTIQIFSHHISSASTVMWNGPLGWFEQNPYHLGTEYIANTIAKYPKSFSVIGGGETVEFITKLGLRDKIDFISTGGGAMLDFISNNGKLVGIEALENNN